MCNCVWLDCPADVLLCIQVDPDYKPAPVGPFENVEEWAEEDHGNGQVRILPFNSNN